MKLNKIFGVLFLALGGIMAVGPWTFARVCTDMKEGAELCKMMRADATILGLLLILASLLLFAVGQKFLDLIISLGITAGGVCGILIPLRWAPGCTGEDMACQTATKPFLLLVSIITMLMGLIAVYFFAPKRKKIPVEEVTEEASSFKKKGKKDETAEAADAPATDEAAKVETASEEEAAK